MIKVELTDDDRMTISVAYALTGSERTAADIGERFEREDLWDIINRLDLYAALMKVGKNDRRSRAIALAVRLGDIHFKNTRPQSVAVAVPAEPAKQTQKSLF